MWEEAKAAIEETFFKDSVELYVNNITENEIGETLEEQELVGSYKCNIEENASLTTSAVSGQALTQSLRISTVKDIDMDKDKTYKLKITLARIKHTDELWKVDGWVEGQLSTVVTVSREVVV